MKGSSHFGGGFHCNRAWVLLSKFLESVRTIMMHMLSKNWHPLAKTALFASSVQRSRDIFSFLFFLVHCIYVITYTFLSFFPYPLHNMTMTKHQGLFEVTLSFYSTAETSSTSNLDIHQHIGLYCLPAPFLAAKIFNYISQIFNYISQIFNHISQSIQLYFLLFLATKVGVEISCKCTIQAQMTRAVMGNW